MKLITRDTDYAIRAVSYIAKKNNKVVSVAELVERLKIPRPFLRKILQVLNKKRILNSHKGQGGGFVLALSKDKINLVELIEAFQGKFKLNECFFKKDPCPNRKSCVLKKKIDNIERYVIRSLSKISIKDIVK